MEVCGREIKIRGRIIRTAYLDGEGFQFIEDPISAVQALRRSELKADLYTFIPRLAEISRGYGYPMVHDNFAVLPVSTFEHWWNQQIGFKALNKAKQAEKKGVVIREVPLDDALLHGIHAIYNESPIRQGRRFPHYGKSLDALRRMKSTFPDRSIFIGAYLRDTLIGFAKLVADEQWGQGGLMHILSMIQHRDKAPTNALLAQAVRCCAERQIKYLWYANFSYGRRHSDSLAEFKLRSGFQKFDLPRYCVPLTAVGRVALRLGLQRGVFDWVPAPLAVTYRRLRRVALIWSA